MKRNKITEQLGSFNNKDEKGLFTFYLETQLPHKPLSKQQPTQDHPHLNHRQPNPLLDSKRITPRKIAQQKKKPIRTLTQQLNEDDSIGLLTRKHKNKNIIAQNSTEEIEKIKELFNFKRKSNQKLIDEFIRSDKKVQSSKSIKLQRQRSNIQDNKNYKRNASISSHFIYPLQQQKQRYFFPSRSPKKQQSLEKDYNDYQNYILPEMQSQSRISLENTLHQLKCQAIIQPQKFKSIVYPSVKKRRHTYIKDHHLLINNDILKDERLSIELKPKYETALELERLIHNTGNSLKINQKISKVTDYQGTPYGVSRFSPTKKHHPFNTLERSLMSSLQIVDQEQFQSDLKSLFKDNSSNLLKKRSHHIRHNANVSDFRVKRSVVALQKPQRVSDIRKNQSQMITLKDTMLKHSRIMNRSVKKNYLKDKSVKQVKHNFLQIISKIKDRYQSI